MRVCPPLRGPGAGERAARPPARNRRRGLLAHRLAFAGLLQPHLSDQKEVHMNGQLRWVLAALVVALVGVWTSIATAAPALAAGAPSQDTLVLSRDDAALTLHFDKPISASTATMVETAL